MIKCSTCLNELPESCFHKRSHSRTGYQLSCKTCSAKAVKEYRSKLDTKSKQKHNEVCEKRSLEIRRYFVSYLKEHPCVDCGESNPVVLDFDHVRGDKNFSVSRMVSEGFSIKRILSEVSKCEVRCSNCHRIATASRNPNHWIHKIGCM